MQELLDGFVFSLIGERGKSGNTIMSYKRDIADYIKFLQERGITDITDTDRTTVLTYLLFLKKQGRAESTISRRLASLRAFYAYTSERGIDVNDPTANLETPHTSRKLPSVLTAEETSRLLAQPKCVDAKGYRDKAMLELLYATGMKVSELISLNVGDVDLKMEYVTCKTASHERVVPIGRPAAIALGNYIEFARPLLVPSENVNVLFLNCGGTGMSRQGFWKIIKAYKKSAGIEKSVTPYTLRHSFAVHLLENGAEPEIISHMLGHADISAMQVYSDILDPEIRRAYDRAHPRAHI